MEIRSFIEFAVESGFDAVVSDKSAHNAGRYFNEYLRARKRADIFLVAYPRFCSPTVNRTKMFLDVGQTG